MKTPLFTLVLMVALCNCDCTARAESGASAGATVSTSSTSTSTSNPKKSAGSSIRVSNGTKEPGIHISGTLTMTPGVSMTVGNVTTELMGINGSASGNRSAGRINFNLDAKDAPLLETRWVFRYLRDCAIQYPSYFYTTSMDGVRLLNTWTSEGARPIAVSAPESEHDTVPVTVNAWYGAFPEKVISNFYPAVRGAIGVSAKVSATGVASVAFFGYRCDIPFQRGAGQAPPPVKPEPGNEAKLKDSITIALRKAAADRSLVFPGGTKSVQLKMFFAGDPVSEGGSWTSWYLLDQKYFKASE